MKKILPALLVTTSCVLGLGIAAASLATANYSPAVTDHDFDYLEESANLPTPVMGNELFFTENAGTVCMKRDRVIGIFAADQASFGGNMVAIVEGRDQAFANHWRAQSGVAKIEVSGVVGHIFLDKSSEAWTIDLVEFDGVGCAMSRTLLPHALWSDLLEQSGKA